MSEIEIPEIISVKELASKIDQPVSEVIKKLISFGVLANLNQDIDFDTASIIADEFGVKVSPLLSSSPAHPTALKQVDKDVSYKLEPRPPVVTVMGHVDHGKTSLLDSIRKTQVAKSEAGGITQNVSAYFVKVKNRDITFIDTPGHSAFEASRKHGAFLADLVILVVAADDGVKPQTVEVINHAREFNVPILVALTKIDKPDADQEKVKRQLAELDLAPEEWGGKTIFVPVVATSGQGIDKLLEMVFLITDIKELKADRNASAYGIVIESHMSPGVGPQSTVLIQNGTLHPGDSVVIGHIFGRVRSIVSDFGKKIPELAPGYAGMISGLNGLPEFATELVAVGSEKEAKTMAKEYQRKQNVLSIKSKIDQGTLTTEKSEGKTLFKMILKADNFGSIEAITKSLSELENEDVGVKIISQGVGDITESDIKLAKSSRSTIFGFNCKISNDLKKLAINEKVKFELFSVIYDLVSAVENILRELMPTILVEVKTGSLSVLALFKDNRRNKVVGGVVQSGELKKGRFKLIRSGHQLAKGEIVSIRRGKQEVAKVLAGSECGLELSINQIEEEGVKDIEIKVNDEIVAFTVQEQKKPYVLSS